MGSGHSWRVDENFEFRPRGRSKVKIGRTDLEGQRPSIALPPVRTDHGLDDGMHRAQDAVMVKGSHVLQVSEEALRQFLDFSQPLRTGIISIIESSGIEFCLNHPH